MKWFLVLTFFLLNCSTTYWQYHLTGETRVIHPTNIPVWIDSRFSEKETEDIKNALNEWNLALNGQIKIIDQHSGEGMDGKKRLYLNSFDGLEEGKKLEKQFEESGLGWVIFATKHDAKEFEEIPDDALAYVDGIDQHKMVIIQDRLGGRAIKDITMHEIGHLLGAFHVNTPSLMYPSYGNRQFDCIEIGRAH